MVSSCSCAGGIAGRRFEITAQIQPKASLATRSLRGQRKPPPADGSAAQAELVAIRSTSRKAEAYSERAHRRQAGLAGLKQALDILERETAFLQRLKEHPKLHGGLRLARK